MIHSISSADNASKPCLSRRPSAAKKSFTIWTFSCVLIEISPFPLHRIASDRFYSKLTLSCFSLLERNARKSIFCSGPVSARQLSHHRYFFDFSHDLICTLLTRPGPCPHRRRDPRR